MKPARSNERESPRSHGLLVVASTAVLVVFSLSACGGSKTAGSGQSESLPSEPQGLTKAAYATKMSGLCRSYEGRLRAVPPASSVSDVSRWSKVTLAATKTFESRLTRLDPPEAEKRTVGLYLAEIRAIERFVRSAVAAAANGDITSANGARTLTGYVLGALIVRDTFSIESGPDITPAAVRLYQQFVAHSRRANKLAGLLGADDCSAGPGGTIIG
jgi:hypothetical protein